MQILTKLHVLLFIEMRFDIMFLYMENYKRVHSLSFFTAQVASNLEDDPGDNTAIAAGAGIGGAVLVILVIIGVIVFIRYRQILV